MDKKRIHFYPVKHFDIFSRLVGGVLTVDIKAKLAQLRQEEERIKEKHRARQAEKAAHPKEPQQHLRVSVDAEKETPSEKEPSHNIPPMIEKVNGPDAPRLHPPDKSDSILLLRERLGSRKTKSIKEISHIQSLRQKITWDMPGMTEIENHLGLAFYRETTYHLNHRHGESRLEEALEMPGEVLDFITNGGCYGLDLRKALFLDTETTGLAGGTGTFAFLIGVGFFKEDTFIVRQYFSPDYDFEAAKLHDLNELTREFPGLVTFNGRSFDMPIINARMVLNRIRPVHRDPPHLDLLFPARRLWKRNLGSCRLTSLERAILRFYREGDIPGALIPGMYMQYLDDRDFSPMEKVMEHNLHDIVTMAALIPRMWAHMEMAQANLLNSREYTSLGCVYERRSEPVNAAEQYEKALEKCKDNAERREIILKLTELYKKTKSWEKAIPLWEEIAANARIDISGHQELAKYYEHQAKDYGKALQYTEAALEMVYRKRALGAWGTFYKEQDEMLKRQERLKKKVEKKK